MSVASSSAAAATSSPSQSSSSSPALSFLVDMFPSLDATSLQQILVQAKENVDVAVEHCLALENSKSSSSSPNSHSTSPSAPVVAEAMVTLEPASQGLIVDDEEEQVEAKSNEEQQPSQMEIDDEEKKEVDIDVIELDGDEEDDVDVEEIASAASSLDASIHSLQEFILSNPPPTFPPALISLRTIAHAISNVLQHPTTEKFRLLPYTNVKFRTKVGGSGDPKIQAQLLMRAKSIFLQCGWNEIHSGNDEGYLLLTDEISNHDSLGQAKHLLEQAMEEVQSHINSMPVMPITATPSTATSTTASLKLIPTANATATPSSTPSVPSAVASTVAPPPSSSSSTIGNSLLYTPLAQLKKQFKRQRAPNAAPAKTAKLTREQMAAKVAARLSGAPPAAATADSAITSSVAPLDGAVAAPVAAPVVQQRQGRIMDLAHTNALRAQIEAARRDKHRKWSSGQGGRKRTFTIDDLAQMQADEMKTRAQFYTPSSQTASAAGGGDGKRFKTLSDFGTDSPADLLRMGKEMLDLTNKFRAEQGKPPLQWNQALHDIGMVHSRNMGLKKVPFSHQGVQERFKAYPHPAQSAAENVAYSFNCPNVPKTHVDGWIDSPGHRKNMLAHHNWCAIAVYRNPEGYYYSTQLFGLF